MFTLSNNPSVQKVDTCSTHPRVLTLFLPISLDLLFETRSFQDRLRPLEVGHVHHLTLESKGPFAQLPMFFEGRHQFTAFSDFAVGREAGFMDNFDLTRMDRNVYLF